MYEFVIKRDKEKGFKGKPFLDIIAGTSIGAINSAVIVSYLMENNTWQASSERLKEFWEYLSKESSLDHIPGFTHWWDYLHNNADSCIATGEKLHYGTSVIDYSVVRSRRIKTSEIIVDAENVIIRTPYDKSLEEINDIIRGKAKWIRTKQSEYKLADPEIVKPVFQEG